MPTRSFAPHVRAARNGSRHGSRNATHAYALDPHVAELYDRIETQTDDLKLIRTLLAGQTGLRILEPFCGSGRLAIPLARDGHYLVGIDHATTMLDRARDRIARLPRDARDRLSLIECDALARPWPNGFDVVLLADNCFYELATPEEQEACVAAAYGALNGGGHVFVDTDHLEGELPSEWRDATVHDSWFPSGVCADGTRVQGTYQTTWFDAERRLVRAHRTVTLTAPDGTTTGFAFDELKHPPSTDEVRLWLDTHGFVIESLYGDREAGAYVPDAVRAIFWARRPTASRRRPKSSRCPC